MMKDWWLGYGLLIYIYKQIEKCMQKYLMRHKYFSGKCVEQLESYI